MKKYWIFQWTGWFGYSAVGIAINLIAGGRLVPLLVTHLVFVAAGISLTHLLRRAIHRRRSPNTSISSMWLILGARVLLISIALTALVIGVNDLLVPGKWDLVSIAALWWGMLLAVVVWVVLYFRFSERRRHEARESQLWLALRESHLLALEAQINPHFLFNALNSIRALVEINPGRAQEMLSRLSNVLRYSLRHDKEHTVVLRSELEVVSDYLALEAIRFGDRLCSSVVFDQEVVKSRVPPMIVQTLVENAVKHGVGRSKDRTDLLVHTSINQHEILIIVENTGKLIESPRDGNQLGLVNAKKRLELLYGERARLLLKERDDRAVATVAIPIAG